MSFKTHKLALLSLLVFAFAITVVAGCDEDDESGVNPASCFDLNEELQLKQLECFGDKCGDWEGPEAWEDACKCAEDGEYYYIECDDEGECKAECLSKPGNDNEWCFLLAVRGQQLSEEAVKQTEDWCDCRTKDHGYWGIPTDDNEAECYSDKEIFCFETSASSYEYGYCLCTAEKWSKGGYWSYNESDEDTGECVTYNDCTLEKAGLKKHLEEGQCEEEGDWKARFYFKDPDDLDGGYSDDDDDDYWDDDDDWSDDDDDDWSNEGSDIVTAMCTKLHQCKDDFVGDGEMFADDAGFEAAYGADAAACQDMYSSAVIDEEAQTGLDCQSTCYQTSACDDLMTCLSDCAA